MSTPDISAAELRDAPLGRATPHPDRYAPALLYALPRAPQRAALGIGTDPPFEGADIWTAYDLTWVDARGRPQVAIATVAIDARSPAIIESKSMKLYFGSLAQTRFDGRLDVAAVLTRDLSAATGAAVRVTLDGPARFRAASLAELTGTDLDALDVDCSAYDVDAGLLTAGAGTTAEVLRTDLFRSICPVTGQPDLGSMQIAYEGPPLDRAALLRYLVSYRDHTGFHEHCVERIFMDIRTRCAPARLTVYARFNRRGGLDINPFRTDAGLPVPANVRTARQ